MSKRKDTKGENSNKQNPNDFVGSLIKPKKLNKKISKKSSSNNICKSHDSKSSRKQYSLTPKGIVYKVLCEALKQNIDIKKFDTFIKNLLKGLSLLSSGGNNENLFSHDFNCFFTTIVQTMNLCGILKQMLEERGIEVDIQEILKGIHEEDDDQSSEDEGE